MRVIALLIGLLVALPASADGWLCVSDGMSGFTFNKTTGHWVPAIFETEKKLVMRPIKNGQDIPMQPDAAYQVYAVVELGEDAALSTCPNFNKGGVLWCQGIPELVFRLDKLEFYAVFDDAWLLVKGDERPSGDVAMVVGRCPFL